jgi:bifunctional DNA-binding transcriptional regulator/antitoxin component of YhaV-PrlF toxin-antitoxin module
VAAQRFTAELSSTGGGGRWVEVPFDAREAFGEARAPVSGTVNGMSFRGRLSVYGGRTYLGLRREIRDAAGIDVGDPVEVVLERDDSPREVEVPAALAAALATDPEAGAAFDALAFTHRREYATWIAEAKRDETRARRVQKSLRMLREGVRHP